MNTILSVLIFGTLAFEVMFLYFFYLLLKILERIQLDACTVRQRPDSSSPDRPSFGSSQDGGVSEIGDIPPEILAPNLKSPPRPAGGFGSRVSKSDGDTQLYKRDHSSSGRDQSGQIPLEPVDCGPGESETTPETKTGPPQKAVKAVKKRSHDYDKLPKPGGG